MKNKYNWLLNRVGPCKKWKIRVRWKLQFDSANQRTNRRSPSALLRGGREKKKQQKHPLLACFWELDICPFSTFHFVKLVHETHSDIPNCPGSSVTQLSSTWQLVIPSPPATFVQARSVP